MVEHPLDQERIEGDADYRNEVRHRCQTDGLFLAPLLGFKDFTEEIHRPVADLYVQKKPGLGIAEQDDIKQRMDIEPRGTFKSSYGVVDDIQWVITCPDVTIAKVTGTLPLGIKIIQRTGRIFVCSKNKRPSPFQAAFPEYVIPKIYNTYRAPCATTDEVEHTLYATSQLSNQTGDHPWIMNPDDMITWENSGLEANDESREDVWNTYTTNKNTVRDGGYIHLRNTRYHAFDAIGRILETIEEEVPNHMDAPRVFDGLWKIFIRQSMTTRDGERLIEGEFPHEDDVTLHFPKMLPYKKLRSLFKENYRTFMCQQQNDPQGGALALFPLEKYRQALMEGERVPSTGEVRICWRLQSDAKDYMKQYAEGVAVLYVGARVYVVDAWRGAYTPTELCERIIKGCKRNQCGDVTIEQTPGSESMIPHIQNEATRQNWSVRIERPEFQNDDAERIGRMKNLQPMMKAGRLWISTWAGQGEQLRSQFTHFGQISQNGLIDAISRLALRIPASTFQGHVTDEQRAMHKAAKDAGWYDRIYGEGGAAEVEESIATHTPSQQFKNSYGLRPMLGGLDG